MAARTRRGLPCSQMTAVKEVDAAVEESEDCDVDVDGREPQEEAATPFLIAQGCGIAACLMAASKGISSAFRYSWIRVYATRSSEKTSFRLHRRNLKPHEEFGIREGRSKVRIERLGKGAKTVRTVNIRSAFQNKNFYDTIS